MRCRECPCAWCMIFITICTRFKLNAQDFSWVHKCLIGCTRVLKGVLEVYLDEMYRMLLCMVYDIHYYMHKV